MFQDIEPYSFSNDFAWVDPEPADRVLVYRGKQGCGKKAGFNR